MPDTACIKSFAPYKIKPATDVINAHQKHPNGFETINEYMLRDFKEPKGFENYVYVSQLLQARGLEMAIEAHRRAKPYCMGSLYWQLNDCWPGISWSSLDYYGTWKAAHYSAKRSFNDLLISVTEEHDSLQVYVVSDFLKDTKAELVLELFDFSGKTIWSKKSPIEIAANSSKKYFTLSKEIAKDLNKNELVLRCTLLVKEAEPILTSKYYYFVNPKSLELQNPIIKIKWLSENKIELSTDVFAKNIYLQAAGTVFFSDNFFDLLPGEKKVISLKGTTGKKVNIKVTSLVNTY